ncbi:MAG: hypothetical protein OFPII_27600 [Osedax symbiont Rs1]|nr:MAG: hypothetical protein OFPII_27600 [Osedax symbiont Rs1]
MYIRKQFPTPAADKFKELKEYSFDQRIFKYLPIDLINGKLFAIRECNIKFRNAFVIPWAIAWVVLSGLFIDEFMTDKRKAESSNLHFIEGSKADNGADYFEWPENKDMKRRWVLPFGNDLKLSYYEYINNLRYDNPNFAFKRKLMDISKLIIFGLGTPLLLIWAIGFRRRALVYFDRERRIVYSWRFGKVYAQHFDKLAIIENKHGLHIALCGANASNYQHWHRFIIQPTGNIVYNQPEDNKPLLLLISRFMDQGQHSVVAQDYHRKKVISLLHDKQPKDFETTLTGILDNLDRTHGGLAADYGKAEYDVALAQYREALKTKWYRPRNLLWLSLPCSALLISLFIERYAIMYSLATLGSPTDYQLIDDDKFVAFKDERCFLIGSAGNEEWKKNDEVRTKQCVSDFAIGRYEITQKQFAEFLKSSDYKADRGDEKGNCMSSIHYRKHPYTWFSPVFQEASLQQDHPVSCINYFDIEAYIKWYNLQTGKAYRLPTEAEWEYAARAGSSGSNRLPLEDVDECDYSNIGDITYRGRPPLRGEKTCTDGYKNTSPVASFSANPFQLFDMEGNVKEWTCSIYTEQYTTSANQCIAVTDFLDYRIARGASWSESESRFAMRFDIRVGKKYPDLGFRLARDL